MELLRTLNTAFQIFAISTLAPNTDLVQSSANCIHSMINPENGDLMEARNRLRTATLKKLLFLAVAPVVASAQVASSPPRFSDSEVAIYRDFLLHYPDRPPYMIEMQQTTVAFVPSQAFRDDPAPLEVQASAYSGRKLPTEIVALTEEKSLITKAAAEGKPIGDQTGGPRFHLTLSEIAFDSAHQHAAFVYSATCGCKGGGGGTVVYEINNGQWKRKGAILNQWMG